MFVCTPICMHMSQIVVACDIFVMQYAHVTTNAHTESVRAYVCVYIRICTHGHTYLYAHAADDSHVDAIKALLEFNANPIQVSRRRACAVHSPVRGYA